MKQMCKLAMKRGEDGFGMKIKKWVIGILILMTVELLVFLMVSIAFPEESAARGHDVIRQSTVVPQYEGRE